MIYCNSCCEFFSEEEAKKRDVVLGDSMPPGLKVGICPYCGSEDLVEAGSCERCGAPILPDEHLCECCEDELYGAVHRIVESYQGDVQDAKEKFLDYIERRWM